MSAHSPTIAPSNHALERWDVRTSSDSVAPETAWDEAFPMTLPTPEYRSLDAGRYHREEGVVLLARQGVVVTVLDIIDPESPQSRVLRDAVERQFGGQR